VKLTLIPSLLQLISLQKRQSSCDLSILVKSNAMRKVCKEKTAEMTVLDKQLADKLFY